MDKIKQRPWDIERLDRCGKGYFDGGVVSSGMLSGTVTGKYLALTPPLLPGIYDIDGMVASNVIVSAACCRLALWNEGLTSVKWYQQLTLLAYTFQNFQLRQLKIEKGERLSLYFNAEPNQGYHTGLLHYVLTFPLETGD